LGGQKCGNTGSPCSDKPVLPRGTYHGTHVADMNQRYRSKHGNTKHLSSCTQLRYHPVACILIDRHRIEPLANLPPHLEELDMLAFCSWLRGWLQGCGKGSPAEGDRMERVTRSRGHHALVHDSCTHTPCQCTLHLVLRDPNLKQAQTHCWCTAGI